MTVTVEELKGLVLDLQDRVAALEQRAARGNEREIMAVVDRAMKSNVEGLRSRVLEIASIRDSASDATAGPTLEEQHRDFVRRIREGKGAA